MAVDDVIAGRINPSSANSISFQPASGVHIVIAFLNGQPSLRWYITDGTARLPFPFNQSVSSAGQISYSIPINNGIFITCDSTNPSPSVAFYSGVQIK